MILGITVLAPTLGGSTELWAKACLAVLMGLVILLCPPANPLPRNLTLLFAGFFCLSLTAYLPADWFTSIPSRAEMIQQYHLPLPGTLSPQPWLSLEKVVTLWLGVVWAYYLLAREWTLSKTWLLSLHSAGICCLAVMVLAVFACDFHPTIWPKGTDVGPFPNHNQSANVFALAGIITLGLWWRALSQHRKSNLAYLLSLLLLGTAVVVVNSRAGVLLLFGGGLVWLLWVAHLTENRNALVVGLIGLFLTVSVFFTVGEKTVARFQSVLYFDFSDLPGGARMAIHQDALNLVRKSPWCGVGLGNFEPIYALHREVTQVEKRPIHPESDWLWLGIEMGWVAPVILLLAVIVVLKRAWPFEPGTFAWLRSAAALGVILFLVHGLVDVSGHRIGSLWPAMFLAAMALPPRPSQAVSCWCSPAFRVLGVMILLLGCATSFALVEKLPLRTRSSIPVREQQVLERMARNDFPTAVRLINETLAWAPLTWRLYYFRGVALALATDDVSPSLLDFQRARFLEPWSIELPFNEGKVWLQRNRGFLTLQAWEEALRRAHRSPGLYAQMVALGRPFPEVLQGLGRWAQDTPTFLVNWMSALASTEFNAELAKLLVREPNLTNWNTAERKQLFALWAGKGNPDQLAERLQQNQTWLEEGWIWLARHRAQQGDYRGACQLVQQRGTSPKLPTLSDRRPLARLQHEFFLNPNDIQAGYALFQTQMEQKLWEDAGITLGKLTARPDCPKYFHFLAMQVWCQQEKWDRAWNAWQKFSPQ